MELMFIPITDIKPNPDQPRKNIKDISTLVKSIDEIGLIHPIKVKKQKDHYLIVCGERRWTAFKRGFERQKRKGLDTKKWEKIPAIIVEKGSAEIMLAENICRSPLHIIEKIEGINYMLVKNFGEDYMKIVHRIVNYSAKTTKEKKLEKTMDAIGTGISTYRVYYSVLSLPKEVKEKAINNPKIFSTAVVVKMARMKNAKLQVEVTDKIIEHKFEKFKAMTEINKVYRRGVNPELSDSEIVAIECYEQLNRHSSSTIKFLGKLTPVYKYLDVKRKKYIRKRILDFKNAMEGLEETFYEGEAKRF